MTTADIDRLVAYFTRALIYNGREAHDPEHHDHARWLEFQELGRLAKLGLALQDLTTKATEGR